MSLEGFRWIFANKVFVGGDARWHIVRPGGMQTVCDIILAGDDDAYMPDVVAAEGPPSAALKEGIRRTGAGCCDICLVWFSMLVSSGRINIIKVQADPRLDLEELRALEAAAPPGRWRFLGEGFIVREQPAPSAMPTEQLSGAPQWTTDHLVADMARGLGADGDLAAAARNALPALLRAAGTWTCPYCYLEIPKVDQPDKTWQIVAQDHVGAECSVAPWKALVELVDKVEEKLFQGHSLYNVLRDVGESLPASARSVVPGGAPEQQESSSSMSSPGEIRQMWPAPSSSPSLPVFRPPPEHAVAVGLMETLGDKRNEEAERRTLEAVAGTPACLVMFLYADGSEARCELSKGHMPAEIHRAPGYEDRLRSEGKQVVPSLAEVQNDPSLLSVVQPGVLHAGVLHGHPREVFRTDCFRCMTFPTALAGTCKACEYNDHFGCSEPQCACRARARENGIEFHQHHPLAAAT